MCTQAEPNLLVPTVLTFTTRKHIHLKELHVFTPNYLTFAKEIARKCPPETPVRGEATESSPSRHPQTGMSSHCFLIILSPVLFDCCFTPLACSLPLLLHPAIPLFHWQDSNTKQPTVWTMVMSAASTLQHSPCLHVAVPLPCALLSTAGTVYHCLYRT